MPSRLDFGFQGEQEQITLAQLDYDVKGGCLVVTLAALAEQAWCTPPQSREICYDATGRSAEARLLREALAARQGGGDGGGNLRSKVVYLASSQSWS